MKKANMVKERIIKATIHLITESDGDIANINTRAIAERANVGIGLINYHFQTKENLLEICVGRIIGKVITAFNPLPLPTTQTPDALLKHSMKLVFDFLIENPAISRISILSDFKNPQMNDHTMKSATGARQKMSNLDMPERERLVLSFALVSLMQAFFLRKEQSGELFGYDINIKEQRDEVLDLIIDKLMGGYEHG